jgi:hypothetical protein
MSVCAARTCGARIFFAATPPTPKKPAGSRMPLDPEPNPDGNVVLRDGYAHVLRKDEQPAAGEHRFMPHFATCPARQSFARRAG